MQSFRKFGFSWKGLIFFHVNFTETKLALNLLWNKGKQCCLLQPYYWLCGQLIINNNCQCVGFYLSTSSLSFPLTNTLGQFPFYQLIIFFPYKYSRPVSFLPAHYLFPYKYSGPVWFSIGKTLKLHIPRDGKVWKLFCFQSWTFTIHATFPPRQWRQANDKVVQSGVAQNLNRCEKS